MKIDSFIEAMYGILNNPEDLLTAFEEAKHLGMNHLYLLMRREDFKLAMIIHMNPFSEELVSIVFMIPLGCGAEQPSMEQVNRLAISLRGAVMAYGECSSILVGYDGSSGIGEFLDTISQAVLGRKASGRFDVEHYSYDLLTIYTENP
ncbi:MAG: hypothetical protein QXI22_02485 [Sulfolobales archaeon]|mgnify:CR=1 FL=1